LWHPLDVVYESSGFDLDDLNALDLSFFWGACLGSCATVVPSKALPDESFVFVRLFGFLWDLQAFGYIFLRVYQWLIVASFGSFL
jgi:hypothetical protein